MSRTLIAPNVFYQQQADAGAGANQQQQQQQQPTEEQKAAAERQKKIEELAKNPDALRKHLDTIEGALQEASAESAKRKERLRELEAADQKRQDDEKKKRDAELPEIERLKKENAELKDQILAQNEALRGARLDTAILEAARELKFRHPTDALALVKLDDEKIFDKEGDVDVKAVKAAVETLAKSRDDLIEKPKPDKKDIDAKKGSGSKAEGDDKERRESLKRRFGI